ncbi:unnamed protein product [Dovyalis caffra]|uniref:Uncharacterized protein n=1 Tax=Dovyalis caffra TaxID=77055 RepID=A0AAV1RBV1_9ROSI|nr:unnamed protein product [Dovyalis caffra]
MTTKLRDPFAARAVKHDLSRQLRYSNSQTNLLVPLGRMERPDPTSEAWTRKHEQEKQRAT